MSDIMTQTEDQTANQLDELSMLKQRAQIMGIQFSNNIGIDTLRSKINAKMEGIVPAVEPSVNPLTGETKPERELTPKEMELKIRQEQLVEQLKLVRLRIQNLDPKKKDLPGEILTVANEYVGTVKKYIPYGEVTDDGYHVPYILYRQLEDRKFLNIRTVKGANGQSRTTHSWAKEFSLEVLPPLTIEERAALATAQAAAGVFGAE